MKPSKLVRRYWPAVVVILVLLMGFPLLGRDTQFLWWTDQPAPGLNPANANLRTPANNR